MLLSSYQRLLRYCGADSVLTDSAVNRRNLMSWLPSVSDAVENWLNRGLEIQAAAVEYFDVNFGYREFWPKYVPIISIASVYTDSQGMWDGRESLLSTDEYHYGTGNRSLVLASTQSFIAKNGLKLTYSGGLAYHAVQSVYDATITGSFTVGLFVYGVNSSAVGIVKAVTATTLTIEVLYGKFEVGETVQEWATEDARGASTATATLDSATRLSLAEAYPEVVQAVEMQIRFMVKNKDRFEQGGVTKDGATMRRSTAGIDNQLQPEATMMLAHLRRLSV
jgi:hypothetical protein